MPELPDIVTYVESLDRMFTGHQLLKTVLKSPFLLRTFEPDLSDANGHFLSGFSRIGKRIVWHFESDLKFVFHLMIAGRFHLRAPNKMPTGRNDLAAFQFEQGTIMLTEASKKKRASLHVVAPEGDLSHFSRGGLEPLETNCGQFKKRLLMENRTLKRALTDPRIFSGIGNAYSDEILLLAQLSPLKRTSQLSDAEQTRLYEATVETLSDWVIRLRKQTGDGFPKKVTAFHKDMHAHGKFGEPCPHCKTAIQRIVYAENECNYCPRCQTNGKLLADRSLSRLLKDEWPKTIDELEGNE